MDAAYKWAPFFGSMVSSPLSICRLPWLIQGFSSCMPSYRQVFCGLFYLFVGCFIPLQSPMSYTTEHVRASRTSLMSCLKYKSKSTYGHTETYGIYQSSRSNILLMNKYIKNLWLQAENLPVGNQLAKFEAFSYNFEKGVAF